MWRGWRRQQHRVRPRKHPVIALITEWKDEDGTIKTRDENSDLGGTMRLGAQSLACRPARWRTASMATWSPERHRHRYEANVQYLDQLRKAGLVISALTQREHLTEIVELPQSVHPGSSACSSTPEFKSTPWNGHPLFNASSRRPIAHQRHKGPVPPCNSAALTLAWINASS